MGVNMEDKLFYYKAQITKIIDGDTFDVDVDLGFHTHQHLRIRLLGIDTPETRITKGVDEKAYGYAVENYANEMWLAANIYVHTVKQDSFGRWLADVYFINERNQIESIAEHYNKLGVNKLSETYIKDNTKFIDDNNAFSF